MASSWGISIKKYQWDCYLYHFFRNGQIDDYSKPQLHWICSIALWIWIYLAISILIFYLKLSTSGSGCLSSW